MYIRLCAFLLCFVMQAGNCVTELASKDHLKISQFLFKKTIHRVLFFRKALMIFLVALV